MKKTIRKALLIILAVVVATTAFSGCGSSQKKATPGNGESQTITDDTGRNVEVPKTITKVAPSGPVAQMILLGLAPDLLVGLSSSPSTLQMPYFPKYTWTLPTFGQFYGSKANMNMEALIDAGAEIIIDLGDRKTTIYDDMNSITKQTGIPAVFYEATLECMPNAYRQLGKLLDREEKAEKMARFIEKTVAMAKEKAATIPESERKSVLYGTGVTGLAVNAEGSSQAQVIDIIGAYNAVIPDKITSKGGGTQINMESVYIIEPDVIVLTAGGPYGEMKENEWCDLQAVKNGRYYEIPELPYCWLSSPPSVNMVLGIWWLGQVVYPDVYNDYDIVKVAQEYYELFYNYDLSEEEAKGMLANSIYK